MARILSWPVDVSPLGGTEQRRESNIIKKSLYILFYSTGEPRASRYRQPGGSRDPVPFHQRNYHIPVVLVSHVLERTTRRKSPATRITSLHRHSFQMFLTFDKSCFSIVFFDKNTFAFIKKQMEYLFDSCIWGQSDNQSEPGLTTLSVSEFFKASLTRHKGDFYSKIKCCLWYLTMI